MVDAPPMHQEFARWYAAVSLGDDQARRQARWVGVSSLTGGADQATIEALLRLAFRSRQTPSAAALQSIRQAFKGADDTFEMSGNDRELEVLAGACLAILMETDGDAGAAAALAATTAGLAGARKPDLPMNLAALGEQAVVRWGEANRKRPSFATLVNSEPPNVNFEQAAKKVREQPNWENVAQAFPLAADAVQLGVQEFAVRQANAIQTIDRFLRVQDEELQMLWWLIGQRSSGYDCALDAIPVEAQPLVFANELADATEFLPGPPSAKAILSRAGLQERNRVSITTAINVTKAEWLRTMLGEADVSPVSTPLHEAIRRQIETGQGDAWVAGWAATTGIPSDHALSALELGNLFYRERLLRLFG